MKQTIIIVLLLICNLVVFANNEFQINHFIVKENLLKNSKIAIIATDSLEQPMESVNGTYNFSLNGFKQELKFNDGVAVCDMPIEKSSFIYIKHQNENGSASSIYYISKKDSGLNPLKISWYILIAIPLGLILLGYMFRKLIGLVIFILVVYIYFTQSKGLGLSTLLESILDGLKSFF